MDNNFKFQCEICKKKFKFKNHFIKHGLRKNTCDKNNICKYCKKSFSRKTNLKSHYLACEVKKFIEMHNISLENISLKDNDDFNNKNFNDVTQNSNNDTTQIQNIINNNTLIQTQNNTTNNITNVILNLSDVKLDANKVIELLDDYKIIEKIIEHTYLNENNPKNHVLLITDFSRNHMQFYQNGEWHKTLKDSKLNQLAYKTYGDIKKCLDNEKINSEKYEDNIFNLMYEDKKYMENVSKCLNLNIYNKKDMILKTKHLNEISEKRYLKLQKV